MSTPTLFFDPTNLLNLDGIDHLESIRPTPNPFWNRARLELAWKLPVMAGITDSDRIALHPMRLATREELEIFHDRSYIETIELFSNQGTAFASRFGLDSEECPVFREMDKYASYPVGSTIDGTLAVAEGEFETAFSLFGGFHHALESQAGGFCYYNDCVIALKRFRKEYPEKKVLYLDTDVHHGNGTQQAFYNDSNVLTISMHELSLGFYPGTGRPEENGAGDGEGYSVNIPLPPLTDDYDFWRAFEELIVPIWLEYKPDLVFWEVGADGHKEDPLADMMLTLDTYRRLALTVKQLVNLGTKKLVAVGGGGYNPVVTAKVWTILLSDLAGAPLPPLLPAEWIELCRSYDQEVKRGGWTDRPTKRNCDNEPNISRAVDDTIQKVKDLIFPVFNLEQ